MKDASAMLKQLAHRRLGDKLSSRKRWLELSVGGVLGLAGTNKLLETFGKSQDWDLQDPLFGVSFCYLMAIFGTVELLVACSSLFAMKRTLSSGLVAWLVINFIAYRVALWILGYPHPWAFVGGLTDLLGVSPLIADSLTFAATTYLLIASAIVFREHSSVEAVGFLKMACPACGGRVKFPVENIGKRIDCPHCKISITLRKAEDLLKMDCFFCKEHIEFPAHALGRKIKCPHCAMEIGLKEAT